MCWGEGLGFEGCVSGVGSGFLVWSGLGFGVLGYRCGASFWERERTVVDFVLVSERERDPDILEQLGPLLDEPHLVQPHVGCNLFGN